LFNGFCKALSYIASIFTTRSGHGFRIINNNKIQSNN
jgi:hypothetical protein